jgi:hypothetical protein
MLAVYYDDTVLSIELPNKYPCENLAAGAIRIYNCLDVDKKYIEFFSITNGTTDRIRVLVPGLNVFNTPQDMIDYPYKSVNMIYYVKSINVLYKYLGSSENATLTLNGTSGDYQDPFVYENGDKTDVVFMYFTTIDDLTNKLGDFRSMEPVFLNNKELDPDTGEVISSKTVAPFTLAQYVFMSTGENLEEKCNQITRLHRLNTYVTTTTATSKIYIVCPFDNFFEANSGSAQVNFMDVYIGSVYVTPDRYDIKYENTTNSSGEIVKKYYIEFKKDADNNYQFIIEAGRTVYITYYYNTAVTASTTVLSMMDGTDIVRSSIPTDRLQKVTDDTNTVDNDVLVSALAIKKLRDEITDLVSSYVGGNVLHCNGSTSSITVTTDVESSAKCYLNKRTGSTIYITLDKDLPNTAQVIVKNVYTDTTLTETWPNTAIPIYLPFTNDLYSTESSSSDEIVPRYSFKAGQTIQLVYNDIMGSPRFYVNNGEHYRLVESWGIFDYEPDISITEEEATSGKTIDIYISNTDMENHISPCIEFIPGVDNIEVYKDGVLLLEGTGYTFYNGSGSKNCYIRVPNLPVDDIATISVKVTSVRNLY